MLIKICGIVGLDTWVKNEWKYSYQMVKCWGWNLLSTNYARVSFFKNRKGNLLQSRQGVERRKIRFGSYRCMGAFEL